MGKDENLRKYELVMIVNAKLTSDEKETIRKDVTGLIDQHGGKVINSQIWLEKQKFTYQIKKCDEGTYYIINFEGGGDVIEKIQPKMRLNEKILRFVFMKVEAKGRAEVAHA